jgi:hypothetical protein
MQVFVDLMLHFGRRGRENLRNLQRSDFAVTRDAEGALFVYKTRDEQTKNHQNDDERADGRMYEIKGKDNKTTSDCKNNMENEIIFVFN